jgi:hypothetical protein
MVNPASFSARQQVCGLHGCPAALISAASFLTLLVVELVKFSV